jgi:uncharacterized cupin superfamily protein
MSGMRTFNVFEAEFEYDDTDPAGYKSGNHRFGPKVGGQRLGATVYELPPGESLCPYHYESEEEWLMVLQGEATIRTPDGETVMKPGDVTAFQANPSGAHKATNNGTETVRLMMWANSDPIGYCVYVDSDNISFWSEGGDTVESVRVKRGTKLDYWDGEPVS